MMRFPQNKATNDDDCCGLTLRVVLAILCAFWFVVSILCLFKGPSESTSSTFHLVAFYLQFSIGLLVFPFGVFSTISNNEVYAKVFAWVMLIWGAVILVGFVSLLALKGTYRDHLHSELSKTIKDYDYNHSKGDKSTQNWDDYQYTFKCCGLQGPQDWPDESRLPISCCNDKLLPRNQSDDTCSSASSKKTGCIELIMSAYTVGLILFCVILMVPHFLAVLIGWRRNCSQVDDSTATQQQQRVFGLFGSSVKSPRSPLS